MFLKDHLPPFPAPDGCHYLGYLPKGTGIPHAIPEGGVLYKFYECWRQIYVPRVHQNPHRLAQGHYAASYYIEDITYKELELPKALLCFKEQLENTHPGFDVLCRGTFNGISVSKLSYPGREDYVYTITTAPRRIGQPYPLHLQLLQASARASDLGLFSNGNYHLEVVPASQVTETVLI